MFFAKLRLLTKGAVHFEFWAPWFFSQKTIQSKAPTLLSKSVPSYRKKVKLTFKLKGNCAKHDGLILLRKIRCFLKKTQFWSYVQLPVGSSPICKDFMSKRLRFLHFCNFPVESSRTNASLEWKLPGSGQSKVATWSTCWITKSWSSQHKRKTHFFKASKTWELSIQPRSKCVK